MASTPPGNADREGEEVLAAARKAAAELLLQTARFVERVLAQTEQARADAMNASREAADLLRQARLLRTADNPGGPPAAPELQRPTLEQAVRDYRDRQTGDVLPHFNGSASPARSPAAPGAGPEPRRWWWLNSPD